MTVARSADDCGKRVSGLELLLLARTLLEVAGEGTDHALLTQTDDGGIRTPWAGSREVGNGAAHPTECRWLGSTGSVSDRRLPGPAELRHEPVPGQLGDERQASGSSRRTEAQGTCARRELRLRPIVQPAPSVSPTTSSVGQRTSRINSPARSGRPGRIGSHPARPGGCRRTGRARTAAAGTRYRPSGARRGAGPPAARPSPLTPAELITSRVCATITDHRVRRCGLEACRPDARPGTRPAARRSG